MDMKQLFDSLYDKLILRDLFGKIVPGTMFIIALVVSHRGVEVLMTANEKLSVFSWALLLGLAWLVSFALQSIGELTHVLRTCPSGHTRKTFYDIRADFHERAQSYERVHAERLIVIKEGCGNAAIAVLLSTAVVFIAIPPRWEVFTLPNYVKIVTPLILFVCFWESHVQHIKRYGEFLTASVDRSKSAA